MGANVDVLAVDEGAVALIAVLTAPLVARGVLVGSHDEVAVSGQTNGDVPPIGREEERLLIHILVHDHVVWVSGASGVVLAELRSNVGLVEREASLGARSPVMVMELRGGSGVTQANIEGETFVLDGVNVAASESVEDVATGESDASSCAKGLWGTTTGGATAG